MNKTIVIIVAMKKEAEKTLNLLNFKQMSDVYGKQVFVTEINEQTVYLVISGIGKVNAAMATQFAIDSFSPSLLLNFGTAGGIYPSVKIKTFYKISKSFQYDFDLTDLDDVPLGYIQDYNRAFFPSNVDFALDLEEKVLATADRFTTKPVDVKKVSDNSCCIFDMEGGAIAEVCYANKVPLYMVKGITDIVGNENYRGQFRENLVYLQELFPQLIKEILQNFTK